ncbi:DUF2975 domain-containing protein [Halobacillus salinarum]|uniref:DUF2975 domain-containing protein n=1 Tax=Halobacillus salinarum TaxID=2932257 RepID=A0ABY4EM22_9BACI|nr:DUF2975 domain-containing protein [Halobacillus salinarum]UOQ44913.1 DUF2975 domain-containing protein [Halobacillus salinarum]
MKRSSTLFLRAAVIMIGIPVVGLCLFLPQIANEAIEEAKKGAEVAYVVIGILIFLYSSAIPFFFALYQAMKLLSHIDKNKSFAQTSVLALKKIRNCAIIISVLYVLALPLIYIAAEWDDAPGLIVIGLVIIGASLVISVFAAVLQRLLQEAIHIKSENDLTV